MEIEVCGWKAAQCKILIQRNMSDLNIMVSNAAGVLQQLNRFKYIMCQYCLWQKSLLLVYYIIVTK